MWTPYVYGSGVQMQTVDNGYAFKSDYAANAQPVNIPPIAEFPADYSMTTGYYSSFLMRGDFSVRMSYTLDVWPPSPNGILLGITLAPFIGTLRESSIYTGDAYAFVVGGPASVPTTDQSGSLMMSRVGETLSSYYWNTATTSWVSLGSVVGYSQDFPITLSTALTGPFGAHAVEVTLGDVQIAGTMVAGPSSPVPEASTLWTGIGALAIAGLVGRKAYPIT